MRVHVLVEESCLLLSVWKQGLYKRVYRTREKTRASMPYSVKIRPQVTCVSAMKGDAGCSHYSTHFSGGGRLGRTLG